MRNYLLILLLLGFFQSHATVFTVTSQLDDGSPGTLRWAIQSAGANLPSPIADSIQFNLPNASALNRRTIVLNSELPILSSNLVIDGTTQFGPPVGTTGARIVLTPKQFNLCPRGLRLEEVSNVEIYGLAFVGFINNPPTTQVDYRDAIYMKNVRNITIGAPTMGNTFTGCYYAIRHDVIVNRVPPPPEYAVNITIQDNKIGRNPNAGGGAGGGGQGNGVVYGVYLNDASNVTIGGWRQEESNEFLTFLNAITINANLRAAGDDKNIIIVKNTFLPGILPPTIPIVLPNSGIQLRDNDPATRHPHRIIISGNQLNNMGIAISDFSDGMQIVNNTIDCLADPAQAHANIGLSINSCDTAMVGGTDSVNNIFNAAQYGVLAIRNKFVTISKNSIKCAEIKGIAVLGARVPVPEITEMVADPTATAVDGKTCAGCQVEVFRNNECTGFVYNGKLYQTTVTADANGDWQYRGNVNCNTTFTTTNQAGTTSQFYAFEDFIFNIRTAIIQNASCGRSNGSIRGIKIFEQVDFYWADATGAIISRDTNLINVPAGTYTLNGTKQNVLCSKSFEFTIGDIQPSIDDAFIRLNNPVPGCNIRGSITGLIVSGGPLGAFRLQWFDQNNVQVGTGLSLINVPQGDYTLRVTVIADPTCFVTAGPYTLRNVPSPVVDLSAVVVTDATCGKNNGSITGVAIVNATNPQSFAWINSQGATVGNALDLNNAPPGKYFLRYDDASPCPAITTQAYTIGNNGLVTIDASAAIIEPSGCTVVKGAIKNITVTGANKTEWVNSATGAVVGSSINLLNVPAGTYYLRAFDTNIGCADSTAGIVIPFTAVQQLTVTSKSVKDETCTGTNGSIQNIVFANAPVGYTFKWIKAPADTFSTALSISGLTAGDYTLIAYDSNGCVQTVLQQRLNDHPSPVINESGKSVKDDICTQQLGSIQNITVAGGDAPLSYTWFSSPANTAAGNTLNLVKLNGGNYYMIVSDANGCRDTTTTIFVDDKSPVIPPPLYEELYVKRFTSGRFTLLNPAAGVYEFFDDATSNNPILTNTTGAFTTPVLSADRDYYVRLVTGSCKSVRTKVPVYVIDFSKVFVPNAFTPNGDGLNDVLRIRVYGKIVIDQFVVYNRWGQTVFLSGEVNKGWNGTTKGQPAAAGNYIWTVQGYDIDGTPINLKGSVMIIR
jgi:gliding motility-associated-like protein